MSGRLDAAVVGGGIGGLVAATYLARAGLSTALFEQAESFAVSGGGVLRALDPRVVKELRLPRRGLKFAERDLALTVLRAGGQPLTLGRDRHATARSLAALSPADAAAFAPFQRERRALARALRPCWWDGAALAQARLKPAQRELVERLSVTSASAWLAAAFETDALKAALAFDAAASGFAPSEPGSALALVWSAAQEMCGLQGAVALPRGGIGGFVQALVEAARAAGVALRPATAVAGLTAVGGVLGGVELAAGERVEVPLVLSALSRRRTLESLAPTALAGLGATRALPRPATAIATLILGLNRAPEFGGAGNLAGRRVVVAERPETYEAALAAARLGRIPEEPVLEVILPPPERTAEHFASRLQLVVEVWPVPIAFDDGALARTVATMIERHVPGFGGGIARADVVEVRPLLPSVARLSASAAERVATPIRGLFLCGDDAEPADGICGRAARQAARAALAAHRSGGHP